MNTLRSTVVVDGTPLGPIEDTRLPGPPPETDGDFLDRHAAHVERFCQLYGDDVESIKTTWTSSNSIAQSETQRKAGWTIAQLVAHAKSDITVAWVEYPPDI